jgi:Immunity protein 53
MSSLRSLEAWYASWCDGDWEHSFGITIETMDNPGWAVRIDLAGTPLAGRPFEPVRTDRSPDDWFRCSVEADVFKGHGGPGNLHQILDVFARWVKAEAEHPRCSGTKVPAAG